MNKIKELLIELDKAEAADSGQNAALAKFFKASRAEAEAVAKRIKKAMLGNGDFTPFELLYAATFRCRCGAGMAYPEDTGSAGSWYCSAILHGQASRDVDHTPAHPFAFYEPKSESQPSAYGASTRPEGTHIEIEPHYVCRNCGNAGKVPRYRRDGTRESLENIACDNCGEKYLKPDGCSNPKMNVRFFHVVVDELSIPRKRARRTA